MAETTKVTFRVVFFSKVGKYVAMAWNYDQGVLVATMPRPTYTEARSELDTIAIQRGLDLRWFDGEYTCAGEFAQLLSAPLDHK